MFNVGDRVRCVKIPLKFESDFTKDKIYPVIEFQRQGNDPEWNSIFDDNETYRIVNHKLFDGCFELVEDSKEEQIMFKVGDRVQCIDGTLPSTTIFVIRNVDTTVKNPNKHILHFEKPDESASGYWAERFKLVEPEHQTDLQELVDRANDGLAAMITLKTRHRDNVETFSTVDSKPAACNSDKSGNILDALSSHFGGGYLHGTWKLRVKPKATFEPFFTSKNNWLVKLQDDSLQVGCKKFDVSEFKLMLAALVQRNATDDQRRKNGLFSSSKLGIIHHQHILYWEDAEKILKALAFVK